MVESLKTDHAPTRQTPTVQTAEAEPRSSVSTSFPQMEEAVLKFWHEAVIFQKTLTKDAPRGDYVFYDGPPFATGTPHYGHIVANIMKDVVPRYQTMRGYHVDRKWGWDCHGLPIENIVEKELGTKSKKEIEALGVGKFNDLCRSKVLTYVDEWKKVITRLGRWADMDNAYKTMDLSFMDSIWWAFKELWNKGLIYKDYRSMHVCPRCETTLSQTEVAEGYKDIKDLSVTAKFKLRAGQKIDAFITDENTYILAWTTTPWTLIGNAALAVGEEIKYVIVKSLNVAKRANEGVIEYENLIIAKEIFDKLESADDKNPLKLAFNLVYGHQVKEGEAPIRSTSIISAFEGYDLIGCAYQPLFNYYADDLSLEHHENGWKIYAGDFVTTEEGTGVVHIAPAFGEDDMKLGKEKNLPFIQHVGLDGIFKSAVTDFSGLHVKPIGDHTSTDVEIIKYLAGHNALLSKMKYEHSYPHCWRCETPLINYATSSWFVGVTKIKNQLLADAKAINWSPAYIKDGRFGNWLAGAHDWSISRQRFWASAIPIWECACGERRVIGGVSELEKLTNQKIIDIHKDKVDQLIFKCAKCDGVMRRVSDVLDCWFESGSMPFAQLHYPEENKKKFDDNFPAQFIAEGVDQTRTWFYYLHVIAGGIFRQRAFSNVIVNGIVLAEDGRKMSKRWQNYPDPMLIMDKYGSDALRAYLLASPVMAAENLNFSKGSVQESLRKNIMVLWNVYKFYEMFADDSPSSEVVSEKDGNLKINESVNVLDQWILIKLNLLIKETTAAMEAYNLPKAMRPITEFIDELSTWYLRRSRDRFKAADATDKQNALATTKRLLLELAKLMAPFTPFIAENLWQKVSGYNFQDADRSVHLEMWPEPTAKHSGWRQIFFGRGEREKNIVLEQMALARRIVELGLAERDKVNIKVRQILNKIIVELAEELNEDYVCLVRDELNVKEVIIKKREARKEEREKGAEEKEVKGRGEIKVLLDVEITPELRKEGLKRDIVRQINLMRKIKHFGINDTVRLEYYTDYQLAAAVMIDFQEEIKQETLCASIEIGSAPELGESGGAEIKIDAEGKMIIKLSKIN